VYPLGKTREKSANTHARVIVVVVVVAHTRTWLKGKKIVRSLDFDTPGGCTTINLRRNVFFSATGRV
jgi:hypothetical protein